MSIAGVTMPCAMTHPPEFSIYSLNPAAQVWSKRAITTELLGGIWSTFLSACSGEMLKKVSEAKASPSISPYSDPLRLAAHRPIRHPAIAPNSSTSSSSKSVDSNALILPSSSFATKRRSTRLMIPSWRTARTSSTISCGILSPPNPTQRIETNHKLWNSLRTNSVTASLISPKSGPFWQQTLHLRECPVRGAWLAAATHPYTTSHPI